MKKLNWLRLFLGGVTAGVVLITLSTATSSLFRGSKVGGTLQPFHPFSNGTGAALFSIFAFLFVGMLLTWCYALIRPRFGPGPKTAAIAALTVWLMLVAEMVRSVAVSAAIPDLPAGPMLPMLYLAMIIISTEVGALVYTE